MAIEDAIYDRLRNFSALTTLLAGSSNIYPLIIPQGSATPAVTYQQISNPGIHAMAADPNIRSPRFQVDSWSSAYSNVKAIAYQVQQALRDYSGSTQSVTIARIFYDNEVEMAEVGTAGLKGQSKEITYHIAQDYIVWYST